MDEQRGTEQSEAAAQQQELLALGERLVELALASGAEHAEAVVGRSRYLSATVRGGEPEKLEEAEGRSLGLRVLREGRVATASSADATEEGLTRLVADALELSSLVEPDPIAGPPEPEALATAEQLAEVDLDLDDPSVEVIDGTEALRRAREAEAAAFAFEARVRPGAGATFSRARGSRALVTSGGFRGAVTSSQVSVVVRVAVEEEGGPRKHVGSYWDAAGHAEELSPLDEVGREAGRRAVSRLGARRIPSGRYPVIFAPEVGGSLVGLLVSCLLGRSIWRRQSYLASRMGSRIASEHVHIVDDPLRPRWPGARPFDGEGRLSRRNVLVQDGVLRSWLLDTYSARKLGLPPTASAVRGGGGGVSEGASQLVLQPGERAFSELLAETGEGLLVTATMGFGFNPVTGDFSRGAAGYWIEGGEVAFPVGEVTVAAPFDALWQGIDAVASDLDRRGAIAVPSFRVAEMTVAGS